MPDPDPRIPLRRHSEPVDLVAEYIDQTLLCSVYGHMARMPAHDPLVALGEAAVPALLDALRKNEGGMAVMHALHTITGEWPEYEQHTEEVAPGFVSTNVGEAREAWLRWGVDRQPSEGEQ